MKKVTIYLFLIIFILAAALFTGCNSNTADNTATPSGTPPGEITDVVDTVEEDIYGLSEDDGEKIRVRHILVESKEEADEVMAKLKDGGDFTQLALEYSMCPSCTKGGDLGLFGHGQMVKPFEDAAFALDVGEMSEPVQTDFGWHIIERIDPAMEIKVPELEKMRAQHILVPTKEEALAIRKQLDEGEKFNDLVIKYSWCPSRAEWGDTRAFTRGEMPIKIFEKTVLSLKMDEISQPVESKMGWHIIKRITLNATLPPPVDKKVRIRHILVATEEEAKEIIKKLNEGADFVELAKEKSSCPSKEQGGELGEVGFGMADKPFEDAIFALEVGEISKPVKTDSGWHIIQREEELPKLRASHILVKTKEEAEEILKKLDEGGDFAELAKEYSICPSKEKGGDLGQFSSGQMVKPFEDATMALKVGEISKPVETQFGWHIIKRTE